MDSGVKWIQVYIYIIRHVYVYVYMQRTAHTIFTGKLGQKQPAQDVAFLVYIFVVNFQFDSTAGKKN